MQIRRINFNLKTTQTRLFIYLVASHTLKLVFLHFGQTLGFFSLLSDAFEVFICVVLVAAFGVVLFAAFGVALVAISSIDVSVALAGANITIALSLQNSSLLKQSKNITLNAQSIEKAT